MGNNFCNYNNFNFNIYTRINVITKRNSEKNNAIDNVNKYLEEKNIKSDNSIVFPRANLCVEVDNTNKLLVICNYNYNGNVQLVDFSIIIECKVVINNVSMTDSLKKTIAGGVFAGVIGMLIGAISSKISNTITNCKVEIIINDIVSPIIEIEIVPFSQT